MNATLADPQVQLGPCDTGLSTLHSVVVRLHASLISDDALDDDLEAVLGADSTPLKPEDVARMTPVLGRVLDQLVNIAHQASGWPPTAELLEVSERADRLQARCVPESATHALAHLRRLAIVLVDLLGLMAVEDDRLSYFGATGPLPRRWSA